MANKSYKEIINTCKCLDYYDCSLGTKEVWEDDSDDKLYVCIWMPQNDSPLPSTIEILK